MEPGCIVTLTDATNRLEKMGLWHVAVFEFLRRPVAMNLMAECMDECGKNADEAILVLVSAMQYVYLRAQGIADGSTMFDGHGDFGSFELFLVRNHNEVYHLCIDRRVQANVPARALPILELIHGCYGAKPVRVIELGASAGMLGLMMMNAPAVRASWQTYFSPRQQSPVAWPEVVSYQGIDLSVPDTAWVLACIHDPQLRKQCLRFLLAFSGEAGWSVGHGSALDFPDLVQPSPDSQAVVVVTSYLLYQLSAENRHKLQQTISGFLSAQRGCWINLDLFTDSNGNNCFVAELDGMKKLALQDDYCMTWTPYQG